MKGFWGCLGYMLIGLFLLSVLIEILPELISLAIFIGAIVWGLKWWDKRKISKQETMQVKKIEAEKGTLEYKMEYLLTMAGYPDEHRAKRQQYLQKDVLNMRDKWYQYLDLRAKLALNGTSTYREEEVLNMMSDELLYRLENADVEITEVVRKEFIEQHLSPLLHDVVDILAGIRPMETININAYELLQAAKQEREPIMLKKH